MYRHDVNYISEPNGRCCFLKGAHSSRKAKQLGTRNEWIWGYMGVQGLTTCPVLARGATSRGEALAAHTPQAAPSYRGSATLPWGHGTWQCCPPSSSSSTCQGQEELNLGNFPTTHTLLPITAWIAGALYIWFNSFPTIQVLVFPLPWGHLSWVLLQSLTPVPAG